ncbi:MAG: hypothetical protein KY454_08370 [Actinobacteria bacterium]|nr:hypothetical protein [Actinomycetota bacterium]MBW3650360.1 hypothetical protein [Actinomycetota bacterium]
MSHIIGRPDDDLLDVMLGHGADPEQAFIGGSEQGPEEGEGFEDRLLVIPRLVSRSVCSDAGA